MILSDYFLNWINLQTLHCWRVVWRRDRRVLTAQLWVRSFMPPSLSWWAEMDVPCSAASAIVYSLIKSSRVVRYSQILHSCILLTLVFRPPSAHRKTHCCRAKWASLRLWRKVYIHPNSTKPSFNPVFDICTGLRVHFGSYAFAAFRSMLQNM